MSLVAVAGGVGDAADDRAGDAEEPTGEGDGEALHLLGTRLREHRLAEPDVFRARGGGGDGEEEALSWQIAPIGHGARQHVADAQATVTRVAVARVAGETAPLLFTAFGNPFWSVDPARPIAALPLQIYAYAQSPYDEWRAQAWAGGLVLVILVALISAAGHAVVRARAKLLSAVTPRVEQLDE